VNKDEYIIIGEHVVLRQ